MKNKNMKIVVEFVFDAEKNILEFNHCEPIRYCEICGLPLFADERDHCRGCQ